MASEVVTSETSSSGWQARQVYALAAVCLLIGLAVGYLFRGSRSPAVPARPQDTMQAAGDAGAAAHAGMGGPNGWVASRLSIK